MSFPRYERYKDSGVVWLGEVPEHWEMHTLKHVVSTPITDGPHETPEFLDEGVPFASAESVSSGTLDFSKIRGFISRADHDRYAEKYLPRRNDIFMVKSGATTGVTAIVNTDAEFNIWSPLAAIRCGSTADPHFVLFYLRSRNFLDAITLNWSFGTQQNIGMGVIENLFIPLPGITEQVEIATFLTYEVGKIEDLIDEQQRVIELLKEKRQALVSYTVTKGLTPNTPLRFSGADWLGTVPSHWSVERAGHLFIERDERSESGDEEMLTVSHLTGVTPRSEKTVNMFEAETTEGYKRVYPGDLVINTLWAWMGAMGVSSHSGIVSPAYHVYRPRPMMRSDYVNALVRISAFAKEASRWSKGVWSSRLRLYPQEMFQILFPVPPLEEQRQISERIREQDGKMAELIQESELGITLLQERRTALISAAVTGKIDVRASVAKPVMRATQYSSGFAHQLLAAEILDRYNSQRMGRIKLQKLIHLCEYHGQVSEVQGDYSRKAAGPFDAKAMAGISKNLKKQKWFEEVKEGERYVYRPLEKRGEHKKYLAHWQAEMPRIDEVLSLLGSFKTRECEIVSTLYAAWNDLLIDGGSTNDAAILHEASSAERWHKSKEEIPPERWKKALQWMKDKGLVPVGYGKHTRHTAGQIGTTTEVAHEPA
jgi:type I restriction enzyme S subunit